MNYEELWTNITALLPSGVDLTYDDANAVVKSGDTEVSVVCNDEKTFVVNGTTLHFEDALSDIINTILVPYILQELDGKKRI